jgi:predicted NAD/FAD-binding protein
VIVATHADQSLRLLADACRAEREILSSFEYHPHNVVLHTDESVTQPTQETAASWNYLVHEDGQRTVSVTYDLNRLSSVESQQPLFLTVHDNRQVDPAKILDQFSYRRPVFGRRSVLSQRRFDDVNGQYRSFYCGAYWRYGFHEDAVRSALAVAASVRNWISSRGASTSSRAFQPQSSQVDADPAIPAGARFPVIRF